MQLIEKLKFVNAAPPQNYTGAAMTAKYVSLKGYNHLTIVIQTGAWAAGTAAVSLLQATSIAAGGAKALGLLWQWNDVAADGVMVKTAVAANTFTIGTALKHYVIEIDASSLDTTGGFDCVTLVVATPGANADFYDVNYILSEPRYTGLSPLVD